MTDRYLSDTADQQIQYIVDEVDLELESVGCHPYSVNDVEYTGNMEIELDEGDYEEWQEFLKATADEVVEELERGTTTCGGTSLSSAAISTTTDEKTDGRLTFIDNNRETHEPANFDVVDEYANKVRLSVYDRDIPASLNGYSPSKLQQCEVVVTYDDETYTGFVTDTDRQYNKSLFTVAIDA